MTNGRNNVQESATPQEIRSSTPQQVDTPSTSDSEVCATPQDTNTPESTPPPADED